MLKLLIIDYNECPQSCSQQLLLWLGFQLVTGLEDTYARDHCTHQNLKITIHFKLALLIMCISNTISYHINPNSEPVK